MTITSELVPTSFSLAAVFSWGTSDFLGGYAARRANAFLLTTVAHASGLVLILILALAAHAHFPSARSVLWAIAGGVSGGGALALFYRALATGRMGLTAPVAAVLGAAVPTIFGMATEGIPGVIQVVGFAVAACGIWLISRAEDGSGPKGIGLATIAGIGFAGFYLCISQAKDGSALWLAVLSRSGALAVTGTIVVFQRKFNDITSAGIRWGLLAGCLDVSGTALFVRATQTGRLDSAVVLTSLYPAVTVLLARLVLHEHFTRWKAVGMFAALVAVPMIASG
ncbi:MAG TPA: DMT family transporter [Terriglobales bacterium]|nr:DMT family transporter [Terriglobales bacterium]